MIEAIVSANERLTKRLDDAIQGGSIFHAYIFVSADREASEAYARAFIKGILSHSRIEDTNGDQVLFSKVDEDRHEDVITIRKSGASTRIDTIRKMQSRIDVRPIGERHIVLIVDGDEMGEETQNALLKTLEEPPGETVLIILSDNVENLIPTIRSRSIVCSLDVPQTEADSKTEEVAEEIIRLAADNAPYYRLKKEADRLGSGRDEIGRFFDAAEEVCHNRLFMRDERGMAISREKTGEAIRAIEEARNRVDRGMSPKYAIKDLLLKIGG